MGATAAPRQRTAGQGNRKQPNKGGLSSMIGGFKREPPAAGSIAADSSKSSDPPRWGSLAIDSNQGPDWGWSIDYATPEAADRRALDAS